MLEKFDVFKDEKNLCYQVRTKNTLYSLNFDDEEREQIFIDIVKIINQHSYSLKNIISKVRTKRNYAKVLDVLYNLGKNGLLSLEHQQELQREDDRFKLEKNQDYKAVIPDTSLLIFSGHSLGDKIKKTASSLGFKKLQIASFDENINIELLIKKSNFIIADSTEWSPFHLETLNRLAFDKNLPWLYVDGVQESSIELGPLFYGRETGCYNCLISRIKSNHEYPAFLTSYEKYLKKRKVSAKPDIVLHKDFYENILANYVVLEVIRFLESWSLPVTWRTVLSIDIYNFHVTQHALLKKPYCELCKPELSYNASPWLESVTLKGVNNE